MAATTAQIELPGTGRVLDPIDRNSEVLFGLFMVLTFTGTLSVATAGRDDVRTMLIAAIGCNLAWGFVDAVMYVLRSLVARGHRRVLLRALQGAARTEDTRRLIAAQAPVLAAALGSAELEQLRLWLLASEPQQVQSLRPTLRELRGALAVFLLVFASTIPVVLPFVFMDDLRMAMRASAAVALAMLYLCGHGWGRHAGAKPWRVGVTMMLLGAGIESVVIALGG